MRKILFKLITLLLVLLSVQFINSQVSWDGGAGTNNWLDAANWNPDGVPNGSPVTLTGAGTVIIDGAITPIASLQMDGTQLEVQNGQALNVAGDIAMSTSSSITGLGTANITCNNLTLSVNSFINGSGTGSGIFLTVNGFMEDTDGTGQLIGGDGNIIVNNYLTINAIIIGNGDISVGGNFSVLASSYIISGTGTLIFNNFTGATITSNNNNLGNVTIDVNKNLVGDLTCNYLTVSGGAYLLLDNNNLTVNNDVTLGNNTSNINKNGTGSNIAINGNVIGSVGIIDPGTGFLYVGGNLNANNILGTNSSYIDIEGNVLLSNFDASINQTSIGGSFAITTSFNHNNGTIIFDTTDNTSISCNFDFYNVQISANKRLSSVLRCTNNLIIDTGATLTVNNRMLYVENMFICSGILNIDN